VAVLDRNFGVFSSATGITITRSSGAFGTNSVLVVGLFTNATWATPSGWALRTQAVNSLGMYSFDRTTAGETSFAFAPGVAGSGVWFSWELSAGSVYVGSTGQESASAPSVTTPNSIPTAGNRHLFAMAGGTAPSVGRSVTAFSNSFVNLAGGQATTQDFPFAARADRDVVADGSTGYSTTATFSAASIISGTMILAYNNTGAVADVSAPTTPTGLVASNVGALSANLAWSPSSDDVGVTGYEIQIVGP
jgi:hypothetical protein